MAHMLDLELSDFVKFIENDGNELYEQKKIIYIGIGTAHNMMQIINGKLDIEVKFDQQYPLFLRNISRNNLDYKTYIILIDENLENPCFTVRNKCINNLDLSLELNLELNWHQNIYYKNIYENNVENIILVEIRKFVKYSYVPQYIGETLQINIYDKLLELKELAVLKKWFVILMDYTGRHLTELNHTLDPGLDGDHILFGLPSRDTEGGCYIDLEEKSKEFLVSREKGYITVFTPFIYSNTEIASMYNIYMVQKINNSIAYIDEIKLNMIKILINNIINNIKNNVIGIYRRLLIKRSVGESIIISKNEYDYLRFKYNISSFENLDNPENLETAIKALYNIIDIEFMDYLELFNKNKNKIEYFNNFIISKNILDPYKMCSEIYKIINQICL